MSERFIFWLFFFLSLWLAAENSVYVSRYDRKAVIPGLQRPRYIDIDDQRLYIVENRVRIKGISLKTFKQDFSISTRKGQGPGEFPWAPAIFVSTDHIYVKTTTKMVRYLKNGSYIDEFQWRGRGVIFPFGKQYLFWFFHFDRQSRKQYICVDLRDRRNRRIKRVLTVPLKSSKGGGMTMNRNGKGRISLLSGEKVCLQVSNDRLYALIPDRKIQLKVFDLNGKMVHAMDGIDIPRKPVDDADRANLKADFKYIEGFSDKKWEEYQKRFEFIFPEYLPRVKDFAVDQDRFYIKTNRGIKDAKYFRVYRNGALFERTLLLPEGPVWKIKNDHYYFLRFSDDEEEWILYRIPLNKSPAEGG